MKFLPSILDKYLVTAAFFPLRSFFQTSSSQEANAPNIKSGKGSGMAFPSLMFKLSSTAPCRVYFPSFSRPAPAPRFTKGRYSPFLAKISLLSTAISWSRMFSSWLLASAVSIKCIKCVSEKKVFQFVEALLVVSLESLKLTGTDLFSLIVVTCGVLHPQIRSMENNRLVVFNMNLFAIFQFFFRQ